MGDDFKCPQCYGYVFVKPYHLETWLLSPKEVMNNPDLDLSCKYVRHIEWQCQRVQRHKGTVEQSVDELDAPLEMPREFRQD